MKAVLSRFIFQHPKIVLDKQVSVLYNPCLETGKIFGIRKIVLDCILILAYNSHSKMEIPIQERRNFMMEISIFIFCLIGCGMTSYNLGKQEGIETTIEHLVDQGMLEVDVEQQEE